MIDLAIAGDAKYQPLNIEAEIENDEWSQLLYKGNLLGYALQVNLEKESIALIHKYPYMCGEFAEFNGYCKVGGDTTDETVPLTILALKAESDEAFQAFMGAHKLDLTLRSHQSTLIDSSYTEDLSAGVLEMCDGCPTRMQRLESWVAKEVLAEKSLLLPSKSASVRLPSLT